MHYEEIICEICENMEYEQLCAVMDALRKGWSRENPDAELICVSLPKNDREERQRVAQYAYRWMLCD